MNHISRTQLGTGLLSAGLSLITPGLGQLRNSQLFKAILFYLLWYLLSLLLIMTGLYQTFKGLIILVSLYLAFYIYIIFDAFFIAYRTDEKLRKPYNRWLIYILIVIMNLFIAGLFKDYINSNWMTAFRVPTNSMNPTLQTGDYIIADNKYFKMNMVRQGDVIIIAYPENEEKKYIERCVALGGQTVEIRDKAVYVNGDLFPDSSNTQFIDKQIYPNVYIDPEIYPNNAGNRDNYGPVKVPKDHCFVLGDNRDNSLDSRYWGFVPYESVLAKPLYLYWSGDKNRIGTTIN